MAFLTTKQVVREPDHVYIPDILIRTENAEKLAEAVADMVGGNWKKCSLPDRWDGRTAERIVQILLEMK